MFILRLYYNSLTICAQPFPEQVLHRMRSSASCFNLQYPRISLRLSSSFFTFFLPSIFPSIACFRRQFVSTMWPSLSVVLSYDDDPFLFGLQQSFISHTIVPTDLLHPSSENILNFQDIHDIYIYIYIYIYIQGVTGGTDQTSGGCSLC